MRRFLVAGFLTAAIFMLSLVSVQAQDPSWKADFFDNPYLSGTPVASATFENINFNWGSGNPFQGVPADNFSARFTRNIWFPESGLYRLTVNVDDQIEVGIDQQVVLRTIGEATAAGSRSVDVNITSGIHTVQLSYQEFTGDAFLVFNWQTVASLTATATAAVQQPTTGGQFATVASARLNFRAAPDLNAQVLSILSNGQSFPIVARSQDGAWYQINVNGQTGWVSAGFVTVTGNAPAATPQATSAPQTGSNATGQFATIASARLNFRNAPSTATGQVISVLTRGQTFQIVGQDVGWYQLSVNGQTGWVSSAFVTVSGTAPAATPQVTGSVNNGQAVTAVNLNFRSGPGLENQVLQVIPRGSTVQIIARNADATWLQVTFNGQTGWVSAQHLGFEFDFSDFPVAQ